MTKYLSCLLCQPGNNKCEHAQYKDLKRGAYHSEKSGMAMAVPRIPHQYKPTVDEINL